MTTEVAELMEASAVTLARLTFPVEVDVVAERLDPDIESSAYFIVAEALTNVVKHARATRATVRAGRWRTGCSSSRCATTAWGGADPHGDGLLGVADRVDALGGRLRIESPAGEGTVLTAQLPLAR